MYFRFWGTCLLLEALVRRRKGRFLQGQNCKPAFIWYHDDFVKSGISSAVECSFVDYSETFQYGELGVLTANRKYHGAKMIH